MPEPRSLSEISDRCEGVLVCVRLNYSNGAFCIPTRNFKLETLVWSLETVVWSPEARTAQLGSYSKPFIPFFKLET